MEINIPGKRRNRTVLLSQPVLANSNPGRNSRNAMGSQSCLVVYGVNHSSSN